MDDRVADALLAERLDSVLGAVADAAAAAGRPSDEITSIVVTKFHPASLVEQLWHLGVRDFGENRLQDAEPKAVELADLEKTWHFIGQLQSNKARAVTGFARIIHSVDRTSLVTALAATEVPLEVFIQLALTDDPGRGGVRPEDLTALATAILERPTLDLRGLMAVAPLGEEPRRAFARVRAASERLRELAPGATALSMGMSGDFRDAVLEGATHLRIGTAITGNRPGAG